MVNKLLIGFGVVVLVAVGSVGAWKLSGSERRAGALGPIDEPIPLTWRGEWAKDAKYDAGQVVSYEESSYVAEAPTDGQVPDAKDGPWALMAARSTQEAQGSSGAFNGTFRSPNGSYSLVVADDGIVLDGPPGSIKLSSTGVEVVADRNVSVSAGQGVSLLGVTGTTLRSNAGVDLIGDRAVSVTAGQGLNFLGATGMSFRSHAGFDVIADKNVSVSAGQGVTLLGATGTTVKSNAGMAIQAQAAMTVQAGGTLYLKGSKIQQN
jgi:hypothetical protein